MRSLTNSWWMTLEYSSSSSYIPIRSRQMSNCGRFKNSSPYLAAIIRNASTLHQINRRLIADSRGISEIRSGRKKGISKKSSRIPSQRFFLDIVRDADPWHFCFGYSCVLFSRFLSSYVRFSFFFICFYFCFPAAARIFIVRIHNSLSSPMIRISLRLILCLPDVQLAL